MDEDDDFPEFEMSAQPALSRIMDGFINRTPVALLWQKKGKNSPRPYAYLAVSIHRVEAPSFKYPGKYRVFGLVHCPDFQGTVEFCLNYETGVIIPSTTLFMHGEGVF